MPFEPTYTDPDEIAKVIPNDWLAQMTDDDSGEVTDESLVNAAVRWAETRVNGYLSRRYILPATINSVSVTLLTVPDEVRDIATDIAIYRVYKRRMDDQMPKEIRASYDEAIKRLEDIRDGKTRILIDALSVTGSPGVVTVSVPDRHFPASVTRRMP